MCDIKQLVIGIVVALVIIGNFQYLPKIQFGVHFQNKYDEQIFYDCNFSKDSVDSEIAFQKKSYLTLRRADFKFGLNGLKTFENNLFRFVGYVT